MSKCEAENKPAISIPPWFLFDFPTLLPSMMDCDLGVQGEINSSSQVAFCQSVLLQQESESRTYQFFEKISKVGNPIDKSGKRTENPN